MEFFGVVKIIFKTVGMIEITHTNGKLLSTIILIVEGMIMAYAVTTMAWYFVFEATTSVQYAESLLWIILFSCANSKFYVFVRQHDAIIDFVRKIELIIEKRRMLI